MSSDKTATTAKWTWNVALLASNYAGFAGLRYENTIEYSAFYLILIDILGQASFVTNISVMCKKLHVMPLFEGKCEVSCSI